MVSDSDVEVPVEQIPEPSSTRIFNRYERRHEHSRVLLVRLGIVVTLVGATMAIAGAIGTGNVAQGSLYMILFGLGTIPMMLAISLAGNIMSQAIRRKINKLIPVLVIVVGLLFILRGLSLGIPFLSPPKQKIEQKFEKSLQEESASLHLESKGDCCSTK